MLVGVTHGDVLYEENLASALAIGRVGHEIKTSGRQKLANGYPEDRSGLVGQVEPEPTRRHLVGLESELLPENKISFLYLKSLRFVDPLFSPARN